ncbi:MAG: type IV pilus modification PilV family protein [Tepidisphaeraceae bacterium]
MRFHPTARARHCSERDCSARASSARGFSARGFSSRGFSFVELMFAVVVLGIGFIMIAAVFPVGLQQTKLTIDETTAAANARGAVARFEQLAATKLNYTGVTTDTDSLFPLTVSPASPATKIDLSPTAVVPNDKSQFASRVPAADGFSHVTTIPGVVRSLHDARVFPDGNAGGGTPNRRDAQWMAVASQFINKADDRNASVILYKRDILVSSNGMGVVTDAKLASAAQMIVLNAQATTHSNFVMGSTAAGGVSGDVLAPAAAQPLIYNLEPRPVCVVITYDSTSGTYQAAFDSVNNNTSSGFTAKPEYDAVPQAITEGTYIVISDDQIKTPIADIGRMNGHIFRVGVLDPATNKWQLAPGYDSINDPGASGKFGDGDDITAIGIQTTTAASSVDVNGKAVAYVLGRGFDNLAATPGQTGKTSNYTGPAQDIAVYTTFVTVP